MSYNNCSGFVYEVQPGDTLYGISRRYNVPIGWIINANRNLDIYNIYVGLRICIPDRSPNIGVIPVVPVRPWPGNIGGPGPVIFPPVVVPPRPRPRPPFPGPGPRPRPPVPGPGPRPPFPGPGPRPPVPGPGPRPRNPFGRVAFGEDYDDYDELETTDMSSETESDDGTRRETNQGMNPDMDRSMGRDMNPDMDRSMGRDMNRDMDRTMGRDMNQDMDRNLGRDVNPDMDRTMGRDMNTDMDRSMNQGMDSSGNRIMNPVRRTNGTRTSSGTTSADGTTNTRTPFVVISYVVKNDDNLNDILERFGISMNDVLRYNDLLEIYLKPGTILRVPNRNAMDEQKYEPTLQQ